MTKNKGFTYYELLIVIAIMSLMVGFISIGIGTYYRTNVNRAADGVESAIKSAKNNAVTRGTDNGWVNFYYKDHNVYSLVGPRITATNFDFSNQDWQKIASGIDNIEFDTVDLNNGGICSLNFKQATGEFNGHDFPLGSTPGLHTPTYFRIRIDKGNSRAGVDVNVFGTVFINK